MIYQPRVPHVERIAYPSYRLDELGIQVPFAPEGMVVAVRVDIDPPQVEGVYTPEEFDARYTAVEE